MAAVGADDVANRLSKQAAACSDQKFVLVGYSRGAAVMRAAASKRIAKELYPKIIALVMYGDGGFKGNSPTTFSDLPPLFTSDSAPKGSPMAIFGKFPDALEEKLLQNCAAGDPVCCDCSSHGSSSHWCVI
jgi:cutinase